MQVPIKLFEKQDKNGNRYFVASPNFPLSVNLRDVYFLIYPDQESPNLLVKSVYDTNKRTEETSEATE